MLWDYPLQHEARSAAKQQHDHHNQQTGLLPLLLQTVRHRQQLLSDRRLWQMHAPALQSVMAQPRQQWRVQAGRLECDGQLQQHSGPTCHKIRSGHGCAVL